MTCLTRQELAGSAYDLSEDEVDELVGFGEDCTRALGGRLRSISLDGERLAPVVSGVFCDDRQRPGVSYSYEWRLGDLDDPDDSNPLGVLLVDYLGNHIQEDLQTAPGLPLWEPDAQRVVHVDVRSDRYWAWPREWRAMGRPWRDELGTCGAPTHPLADR